MKKELMKARLWSVLVATGAAAAFTGMAFAQSDILQPGEDRDAGLAPLFNISEIFQDSTIRLQRENQERFTLKRSGNRAFLKFDDDPEVWALTISTGPGNTELFKNDIERLFLRLSDSGNLSLYTPDYPGEPIAVLEDTPALEAPGAVAEDFEKELSTYVSLRLGREITLRLDEAAPGVQVWFQDAARIAVKGMIKAARDSQTIDQLNIVKGAHPDLELSQDGVLTVYVNPSRGFYGRVSSDKVILFLKTRFNS